MMCLWICEWKHDKCIEKERKGGCGFALKSMGTELLDRTSETVLEYCGRR